MARAGTARWPLRQLRHRYKITITRTAINDAMRNGGPFFSFSLFYFMVGMEVAALSATASDSRHRLVTVFSCVRNCTPALPNGCNAQRKRVRE